MNGLGHFRYHVSNFLQLTLQIVPRFDDVLYLQLRGRRLKYRLKYQSSQGKFNLPRVYSNAPADSPNRIWLSWTSCWLSICRTNGTRTLLKIVRRESVSFWIFVANNAVADFHAFLELFHQRDEKEVEICLRNFNRQVTAWILNRNLFYFDSREFLWMHKIHHRYIFRSVLNISLSTKLSVRFVIHKIENLL